MEEKIGNFKCKFCGCTTCVQATSDSDIIGSSTVVAGIFKCQECGRETCNPNEISETSTSRNVDLGFDLPPIK